MIIVELDASELQKIAIGVVLGQRHKNSEKLHPGAFFSKEVVSLKGTTRGCDSDQNVTSHHHYHYYIRKFSKALFCSHGNMRGAFFLIIRNIQGLQGAIYHTVYEGPSLTW